MICSSLGYELKEQLIPIRKEKQKYLYKDYALGSGTLSSGEKVMYKNKQLRKKWKGKGNEGILAREKIHKILVFTFEVVMDLSCCILDGFSSACFSRI